MDGRTILIADDESRIRKLVRDFLEREHYIVLEAEDGLKALEIFQNHPELSLILLDIMMPGMDGEEVCRQIRGQSDIPIVFLTAKGDELDELNGFDLGADEYISKPFNPKILTARVNAVLRRTSGSEPSVRSAGGIIIDEKAHEVKIDGVSLELSSKEYELLDYLLQNEGTALSREKILNQVWKFDFYGDTRTIDTHIKKLRSKMGEKGDYIKTVWGMGYKFEVTR